MDDEYELMPANELAYLRKEVEKLKRNPLGDTQASIGLLDSLNKLSANVQRLNDIFAGANDDMVKAFNEASFQEQLRKLSEQQEKLAKGIVAVAELVKEMQKKQPLPDLDQLIPQKTAEPQHVALNAQALAADLQNVPPAQQPRNPFEEPGRQQFQPLLNQPLPRPGNDMQPPPPLPQRPMMNANGNIPEMEVPPPPPRR